MGCGVCCGSHLCHGVEWTVPCGRGENAGRDWAGAAGYRAEGHQPDGDRRRHCVTPTGYTGNENAGDWRKYVAFRYGGGKVLAAKYALLKQYAETWSTMTDHDALIYVRHWMEVDAEAQALRLKYVPKVSQALPGKKAATFFQLDRRLSMLVDLQLFSQIPLAHAAENTSGTPSGGAGAQ